MGGGVTNGAYCNYVGSASGKWSGRTTHITVSSPTEYILPGATVAGPFVPFGTTVSDYSFPKLVLSHNAVASGTNVPLTFSAYKVCDGTITGTADGDFELIVNTGTSLGGKWIEFWGANASQLAAVSTNIKAKSMRVPE